jgi:uncharacterized protein YndB with AHSA1/START domain
MSETPADRVLVIERLFDAPRALVFKVWTQPEHAARWYGPRGFTPTHMQADVRPGGAWRTCLHRDADGLDLWHGGVYREVVQPQGNRVNGKLAICAGLPAFSLSSLKEGGEGTKFGSEAGSRFTRLPWVPPERLVFTFAWDGAQGMPERETLVTLTFADRQGRTLMTLPQEVFDSVETRDSHDGGWTSVMDKLAEYLATL